MFTNSQLTYIIDTFILREYICKYENKLFRRFIKIYHNQAYMNAKQYINNVKAITYSMITKHIY